MRIRDYFDRVVVINLDRRQDRWERLQRHLETLDWPFRAPERFRAVDGDATGHPSWWQQGNGAWGCMMSHARVLEECLCTGVERVLVLEDDVVFASDLAERCVRFLEGVPADWDQLYLGGQHLIDPQVVNDEVYRAFNVNRTHAYAVQRRFMARMYQHVLHAPDYQRHRGHHVDHRLGALHESRRFGIYTPRRWLAGQLEGRSDISGNENATYFWDTWAAIDEMPFVVVLGLHDGRANEVAAELAALGVHFGRNLGGIREPRFEDAGLAAICEELFPFPETWRQRSVNQIVAMLRPWFRTIQREAADHGGIGGACYPQLCALRTELSQVCRHLKVVELRGDDERAMAALQRRVGAPDERSCRRAQELLQREREHWSKEDRLVVDVGELDHDREGLRRRLRDFVGLAPPPGVGGGAAWVPAPAVPATTPAVLHPGTPAQLERRLLP